MADDTNNSHQEDAAAAEFEIVTPESSSYEETKKELEKVKNDFLYLRAEFDNFRRNAIKERSDLLKYGGERMARELLETLDSFDIALDSKISSENFESVFKGLELTANNMKNALTRIGIEEINPLGEPFNPSLHEAISSEPSPEFEPGHICRVFKKAYKLHDRLLRPAQVAVATAMPEASN